MFEAEIDDDLLKTLSRGLLACQLSRAGGVVMLGLLLLSKPLLKLLEHVVLEDILRHVCVRELS